MRLEQLSVSQVESFDHSNRTGCARRWWFERVRGLKPEQDDAQSDGEAGHLLLATYFQTGKLPQGRVKMGKAVTAAILKGELPKPGPDMLIEERFDGQPRLDSKGEKVPLDVAETFHLGGLPWDGYIDLAYRRGDVPTILDHKFSSDIDAFAKPADGLIKTVQMPIYVLSQLPFWPDAKRWEIAHHNVSRVGTRSFIRSAIVGLDEVLERKAQIEAVVESMKVVAATDVESDVPANTKTACDAWNGCPHQSICKAYKERNQVKFTSEEMALFNGLVAPADAPAPTAVAQVLPPDAPVSQPTEAARVAAEPSGADPIPEPKKRRQKPQASEELFAVTTPPMAPPPAPAIDSNRAHLVAGVLEAIAALLRAQ